MQVFLLAAGLGTRLKPLTDAIPKCLVPINNKPLMEYWFDIFDKCSIIDEVIINTHYLPQEVEDFISCNINRNFKITTVYEEELLGSAGTILKNRELVREDDFLICYADNYSEMDLNKFIDFHKKKDFPLLTMGVQCVDNYWECGIVYMDSNANIKSFVEKPQSPIASNLANAGIYMAKKELLGYLDFINYSGKFGGKFDFGKDVIPLLVTSMSSRLFGYYINERHVDIGTFDKLEKVRKLFK